MNPKLEHIQWLQDNWLTRLEDQLKKESIDLSADHAFTTILAADPTENKFLSDWLIKTYCGVQEQEEIKSQAGFRWEDICSGEKSKAAKTLSLFAKHFRELGKDQRNIYQYKTLGSLWKAVKEFDKDQALTNEKTSARSLKREERNKILEQTRILWRDDDFITAIPLTQEAACWWGRGTQWCTAADKDNYFHHYNNQAPLVVMIIEGEKYQLWASTDDFQLMDENDQPLSRKHAEGIWPWIEPIMLWSLSQTSNALSSFSAEFLAQNTELLEKAVEQEPRNLRFVPHFLQTAHMCDRAIEQNWTTIQWMDKRLIKPEYIDYVQNWNTNLFHIIPDHLVTSEFIEKSIRNNPNNIFNLPRNKTSDQDIILACSLSVEVCEALFLKRLKKVEECSENFLIEFINKAKSLKFPCKASELRNNNLLTPRVLEEFEKYPKWMVSLFPDVELEPSQYYQVLRERPGAIVSIPTKIIDHEMAKIVVGENAELINEIPGNLINYEICLIAAKNSQKPIRDLGIIPPKYLTRELLESACQNNGRLITQIREHTLNANMIGNAVKSKGIMLSYVLKLISSSKEREEVEARGGKINLSLMFEHAVSSFYRAIEWIPKECLTPKICELAVEHSYLALDYIPTEHISEEIAWVAIQSNECAIRSIPSHVMSRRIVEFFINDAGGSFYVLPPEWRLDEFRKAVVPEQDRGIIIDELESCIKRYQEQKQEVAKMKARVLEI